MELCNFNIFKGFRIKGDEVLHLPYSSCNNCTIISMELFSNCRYRKFFYTINANLIKKNYKKKSYYYSSPYIWTMCDMEKICKIAKKHKLFIMRIVLSLMELKSKKSIGSFGDITFVFIQLKI